MARSLLRCSESPHAWRLGVSRNRLRRGHLKFAATATQEAGHVVQSGDRRLRLPRKIFFSTRATPSRLAIVKVRQPEDSINPSEMRGSWSFRQIVRGAT